MGIRIGMIGNGRIASRFVAEARTVGTTEVACIYNPKIESAKAFAKEHDIPLATDQLDRLVDAVDAVYIAVPHQFHYDYAKRMLLSGKHVLCEKPLCFSGDQARELFQIAEERGLILMEAMKTNYCPGFQAILTLIQRGEIGQVVDVEAAFTRIPKTNVREVWDAQNGGSFTEFGTYAMLPIVKFLGTEDVDVEFRSRSGVTGVDTYTKAIFTRKGENTGETVFGTAKTGLSVKSEGQLLISGTKGYILVPSLWWLTKIFLVCRENPEENEIHEAPFEGDGLRYEIFYFIKGIQGRNLPNMLTTKESIWLAEQMEMYLAWRRDVFPQTKVEKAQEEMSTVAGAKQEIWAHRGCSFQYPENTIPAFQAAAKLDGITGIELDIQLTKDGEMVVLHDEMVDATTTGTGLVKDFTLAELQKLSITGRGEETPAGREYFIPTIRQVFEALKPQLEKGLRINIELKNSIERYEGMEEKIVALVREFGLEKQVVYSSFLPESMGKVKELDPAAETAILGTEVHWCIQKMQEFHADAVHPYTGGLDLNVGGQCDLGDIPVRVWNMEEPLYGTGDRFKDKDLLRYGQLGSTAIFTNVPEKYV